MKYKIIVMNDMIMIVLIGLILIFGFCFYIVEKNYEKNLPVSNKFPKYTNYDLAKTKYFNQTVV